VKLFHTTDFAYHKVKGEHYPFFNLRTGDIGKKQAGPKKKLDIYEIPS
jgi:hypothetical protein